jgi:hypothetical protein
MWFNIYIIVLRLPLKSTGFCFERKKSLKISYLLVYFILYSIIARDSPCVSTMYYLLCFEYIMVLIAKKIQLHVVSVSL